MRTYHTPGGYHPRAKDLFFIIHKGRSVHLFQRVFGAVGGCLPVLAGVRGCWRALVTPHVL